MVFQIPLHPSDLNMPAFLQTDVVRGKAASVQRVNLWRW